MELKDRKEIEKLISHGLTYAQIGNKLRLSQSHISKEVKVNGGRQGYQAEFAQKRADDIKQGRETEQVMNLKARVELYRDRVCELLLKKKSVLEVSRSTGASVFIVKVIANKAKIPIQKITDLIEDILERIDKLEKQIKDKNDN